MACGLAQVGDSRPETKNCRPEYRQAIAAWQSRAGRLRGNFSYLANHALHYWHGSKAQRGYSTRWRILQEFAFNPHTDLCRDWQGLYQLTPDKPGLRDALRRYFASRNEDDSSLGGGDRPLV
jgi:hypothetical protein